MVMCRIYNFNNLYGGCTFEFFLNYQQHKVGISANYFFPLFFLELLISLVENAT